MSRIRLFALLAVGALLGLPAAATAQNQPRQGPVVESARQVTTDPSPVRLHSAPQIAVHPDDPLTAVIAVGDARNGGCSLHATRDGGLSWTTTADNLLPEGFDFCIQRNFGSYISPAFARDGTLYVGFSGSAVEEGHPNAPITALMARTNDLGQSHETFVVADPGSYTYRPEGKPAEQGFEQHRYASLAVDPTNPNRVYQGWRLSIGGVSAPFGTIPVRSMIAVSNDGGETWSKPVDIQKQFTLVPQDAEPVFGSDIPMLVVGPDGTAYAFTKERPPRTPEGEPRPASRIFMFKSTDGGQTWSTTMINEGAAYITNPAAAVDPNNGNLYVVWEARGTEETNPAEIYMTVSTDDGETWSKPQRITDDDPSKGYNQYFPGISVAPGGRVDVAWYDYRNDPFFTPGVAGPMGTTEGERYWDVYYSYSTDGGKTWSKNLRVTDRSIDGEVGATFNNQDIIAPIGIASTDRQTLLTWPDSRAGNPQFDAEDAYFTRVRFEVAPVAGATGADSRALWSILGAGAALAVGGLVLMLGTRLVRRGRPEAVPEPAGARR